MNKLKRNWNQKHYSNTKAKADAEAIYNALFPVCRMIRVFLPVIDLNEHNFRPIFPASIYHPSYSDAEGLKHEITNKRYAVKHIEGRKYQLI